MPVRLDLVGSAAGLMGALIAAGGAVLTAATGVLVSEANGAFTLLILMLAAFGMAVAFAVSATWIRTKYG